MCFLTHKEYFWVVLNYNSMLSPKIIFINIIKNCAISKINQSQENQNDYV